MEDSRARSLTPEARYALHLREAEGRCLEWRSRFSAAKVTLPKESPRMELTETEIKDRVFMVLSSPSIFFAVSAPESHVRVRIAAPEVLPTAEGAALAPADVAESSVAAAAPAEEVVEEAEMPDDEEDEATWLNCEAFDRQRSRYGHRGGQPQVLALTSTDPYGTPASAASSTPSSATTNVSSAGSSVYIDRECPRGSYLSGSVSSAALQLTQRTMCKEKYTDGGVQPRTPSASAPVPKRQRTTESTESMQVLFPGTVTQDELMPPPTHPAVGVLRGQSTSHQPTGGDQSGYPRQQSRSLPRSSAGAGRVAPQQTETEYTSLPESQGGVYMGRGGPPTFPPRTNLFATRSFHRGAGGGGGQRRPFPPPIPERPTGYLLQRRPPTQPCSHCGILGHYDKQCTGPLDFAWRIQQQRLACGRGQCEIGY